MENEVILKNSSGLWNFVDELELENFIWKHLFEIFHLEPLERQSTINGQICDILAVTQNKQLVIIELKNTEDRYSGYRISLVHREWA
jgi:RecB family endonuclease NucS